MKKIFYIIIMALCLSACCSTGEIERKESDVEIESLYLKDLLHMRIYRFKYDNHKYIWFYGGESRNGFMHDPDCPCHEQYVNKGGSKQETSDYPDWW